MDAVADEEVAASTEEVVVVETGEAEEVAAVAPVEELETGPAPTQTAATRTSHGAHRATGVRSPGQKAWETMMVVLEADAAEAVEALVTEEVDVVAVDSETVGVDAVVVDVEVSVTEGADVVDEAASVETVVVEEWETAHNIDRSPTRNRKQLAVPRSPLCAQEQCYYYYSPVHRLSSAGL